MTLELPTNSSEVDRFLSVVLLSGLTNSATLTAACSGFVTKRTDDQAVAELCDHLVREKLLTDWQASKLKQGKYKGFILDGYKLLANLGKDLTTVSYLVEEVSTGKRLMMAVTPPALVPQYDGRIRYELRQLPKGFEV